MEFVQNTMKHMLIENDYARIVFGLSDVDRSRMVWFCECIIYSSHWNWRCRLQNVRHFVQDSMSHAVRVFVMIYDLAVVYVSPCIICVWHLFTRHLSFEQQEHIPVIYQVTVQRSQLIAPWRRIAWVGPPGIHVSHKSETKFCEEKSFVHRHPFD